MACVTKKKGRWAVDFYDQFGKRRLKMLPQYATKGQAKKLLREIEDQLEKRTFMPTKNIPAFSKVAKAWHEYKKPNVRASTWKMYGSHLDLHFKDIDELKINRITTATVEKFITDHQEKGVNLGTLRKTIVTFNQVMNYAVRHRYIDHNPVRDAERPRGQGEEESKVIRILNPSEINSFLGAVKNQKFRTLFMLAIMSGARQGELFGLKWSDIDWNGKQIHIQRTFNNGMWFKPKSKTSIRKIDIGPAMLTQLKRWKLVCPKNELDLVFPNQSGNPLDHGYMLRHYFWPALKAAKLPKIRFHDLRHTYASLLIEQGENIKYIQNQLGHSSPMLTLTVYAHLMKPANQEAACRLEKVIFETNGDQMETNRGIGIVSRSVTY